MGSNDRRRQTEQIKNSSDRERIKNITNEIHPEYSHNMGRDKKSTKRTKRASEPEQGVKKIPGRSKQSEQRRKKVIRKRKVQSILRFAAACLVIAALGFTFFIVKNYNTGSRHDSQGMTAYENGNYENAVKEFKEALSYDDENTTYYIHLGMAYIEQKAYDEALGYFNQAEACTEDENQIALVNRGRGIAYLYQGNYDLSVSAFAASAGASGISNALKTDVLYYKAEAEEKANDYESAVDCYTQIINISDDAGARMLRGLAYAELSEYTSAEEDLYAAIDKSRKSYAIYRALYSALEAQGKTDEAAKVLNDALELSGSSGEDYFNRGMIYLDLKDDAQALSMFNTAKEKGYTAALLGLGEVAMNQEDYDAAKGCYEQFLTSENLNSVENAVAAKAYNQYAVCLMTMENYEGAVDACTNGLSFNDRESDESLSFNQIVAYEHLGQWENAYNTAKTYVEKYPDNEAGVKEYTFLESRVG